MASCSRIVSTMVRYVKNMGTMHLHYFDVGHHPKEILSRHCKNILKRLWREIIAGFLMHACLHVCGMAVRQHLFVLSITAIYGMDRMVTR